MELIQSNTIISLIMFGIILVVCMVIFRRNRQVINRSIRLQEHGVQQNESMLKELRLANRLLARLAEVELTEERDNKSNNECKLYIGNIDYSVTEEELESHFSRYGDIEGVNIPINRYNGKARGFGFVTFASRQNAEKARELDGSEFKGRQIQVNFAKEREGSA